MGNFDLYGNNISLQVDMDNFIFGSGTEAPKGKDLIYRRIRKGADSNPTKCVCVSDTSDEPDRDTYCPYCLGSKYYWDEEFVKAYWYRPGPNDNVIFYFNHDVAPSSIDELIMVSLNDDGTITTPMNRVKIYNIVSVDFLRGDHARLAYYRVIGAPMNRRYLGP